jgi:hypothetical protein
VNKGNNLGISLLNLARQSPLVVQSHDLDTLERPPDREPTHELLPLTLLLDHRNTKVQHLRCKTEREPLGRTPDRVPHDSRLDLLTDFEVFLGVEVVEVEEVDRAVKVAEELDVETGGEGGCDEGRDEMGGQNRADGGRVG